MTFPTIEYAAFFTVVLFLSGLLMPPPRAWRNATCRPSGIEWKRVGGIGWQMDLRGWKGKGRPRR